MFYTFHWKYSHLSQSYYTFYRYNPYHMSSVLFKHFHQHFLGSIWYKTIHFNVHSLLAFCPRLLFLKASATQNFECTELSTFSFRHFITVLKLSRETHFFLLKCHTVCFSNNWFYHMATIHYPLPTQQFVPQSLINFHHLKITTICKFHNVAMVTALSFILLHVFSAYMRVLHCCHSNS